MSNFWLIIDFLSDIVSLWFEAKFSASTVTKLLALVIAGRLVSSIRDANAALFSICDENYTCLPDIGENPSYGYTSYDNMGLALLTSFQLLTLDFWENTYNMILRASGTWNVIYFILVILLGPFYLLNLLLAVVTMAYSKEHEKQEELREMRKKAKERARNKALRRMKQLERQNIDKQGSEGEDGRGSNLWAATISSTRIGLGVGISSRSDSGTTSPQVTIWLACCSVISKSPDTTYKAIKSENTLWLLMSKFYVTYINITMRLYLQSVELSRPNLI